jgi:sarcosine oxidase subunit beta
MQEFGLDSEPLEPREIRYRWPFLRVDDLAGGSYTATDGYAGPYEVMRGFIQGARRLGATLRERVEATGIEVAGGRVRGVMTSSGERVETPVVVNAAGPDAAVVGALAGLEVPVRPVLRHLFFTGPFERLPSSYPLVVDLEYGWYMRREGDGLLLSGPQETDISGAGDTDFEAREWTAARSVHRAPVLEGAEIARGWTGFYEISPDHHAIIGSFKELEGFICANGFSGHGFQHGPAAGIVLAELISEGTGGSLDIGVLTPERFRRGHLIHEPLTAFRD